VLLMAGSQRGGGNGATAWALLLSAVFLAATTEGGFESGLPGKEILTYLFIRANLAQKRSLSRVKAPPSLFDF